MSCDEIHQIGVKFWTYEKWAGSAGIKKESSCPYIFTYPYFQKL
jgi:hypothetical protein